MRRCKEPQQFVTRSWIGNWNIQREGSWNKSFAGRSGKETIITLAIYTTRRWQASIRCWIVAYQTIMSSVHVPQRSKILTWNLIYTTPISTAKPVFNTKYKSSVKSFQTTMKLRQTWRIPIITARNVFGPFVAVNCSRFISERCPANIFLVFIVHNMMIVSRRCWNEFPCCTWFASTRRILC